MTARCASATNPVAPVTASVIPARHGRPTSRSWGHRLEAYRGSFGPVKDLNTKIRAFSDGWNDRCHPFVWTKIAEQILRRPTVRPLQTGPPRVPMVHRES